MRARLSRLTRLFLPALALVAAVMAWSHGAQAAGAAHHQDGAHAMHAGAMHAGAMPCADEAAKAVPGDHHDSGKQACPDCLCPATGCASAALPGMTGIQTRTFTPAPLRAVPAARLETQALVGPPAEPPRL